MTKQAYTNLEEYNPSYSIPKATRVRKFLNGISDVKLKPVIATVYATPSLLNSLDRTINFLNNFDNSTPPTMTQNVAGVKSERKRGRRGGRGGGGGNSSGGGGSGGEADGGDDHSCKVTDRYYTADE